MVHTLNGHGFDLVFNLPSPENFHEPFNRSTNSLEVSFLLNGFVLAIKRPEIRRSSVMVHKILPSFPVENDGKGWKTAENGWNSRRRCSWVSPPHPTVQHCPHRGHPHLTGRDHIAPTQGLGEVTHLRRLTGNPRCQGIPS